MRCTGLIELLEFFRNLLVRLSAELGAGRAHAHPIGVTVLQGHQELERGNHRQACEQAGKLFERSSSLPILLPLTETFWAALD